MTKNEITGFYGRLTDRLRRIPCISASVCLMIVVCWPDLSLGEQALKEPPTLQAAIEQASDSTASARDQLLAYEAVCKASEPGRSNALANLVVTAGETIAVMAGQQLVCSRDPVVIGLITRRFSTWSYRSQWVILNAFQFNWPGAPYGEIPRIPLRLSSRTNRMFGDLSDEGRAISVAALILSRSAEPEDGRLIAESLLAQQRISPLWLARASRGPLNLDEARLGASIVADESAPPLLKLAVEVALAPSDRNASFSVVHEIRGFLLKYRDTDVERMLAESWLGATARNREGTEFAAFMAGLKSLGMLQFLKADLAESVTFEFLKSRNEYIRRTLALVAAVRWPEHLAQTQLSGECNKDVARLRAVSEMYHPESIGKLYAGCSAAALETARSELRSGGLNGVFPWAASAAFGF